MRKNHYTDIYQYNIQSTRIYHGGFTGLTIQLDVKNILLLPEVFMSTIHT